MPDEAQILGVPSVGPNGEVTAFVPNPPWNTSSLTIWPAFFDSPSTSIQYFVDVFGALHLRGWLEVSTSLAAGAFTPMLSIILGYGFPSRQHRYPVTLFTFADQQAAFSTCNMFVDNSGGGPTFMLENYYPIDVMDNPYISLDGFCIQP